MAYTDRATAKPDDLCVPIVESVAESEVLLLDDLRLPTLATVQADATEITALNAGPGRPVWLATLPSDADAASMGLTRVGWDAFLAAATATTRWVARAMEVTTWRRAHRFCGACRTELADLDWAIARKCPSCGLVTVAKAQPVALVAVWRPGRAGGHEVLLVRHTYGAKHLWALVGGYVDPAETLEEAARREVAEEVGLAVDDLRYFGSEGWGLSGPGVLLSAFTARSTDPEAEPVVDGHELAQARFFPLDALPQPLPPAHLVATRAVAHLAELFDTQ